MAAIEVIRGDITAPEIGVDAIVNAANSVLAGGGGVDGAIHRAAGQGLHEECARIAAERRKAGEREACPAGEAVLTGAYRLPCKGIIHTVGPVWRGGGAGEQALLASCYRNSLILAGKAGFASAAFPNVSTGVYGYPREEAAVVAVETVKKTLAECPGVKRVVFVCFDRENLALYQKLLR